ncbi:DUF6455 family protein [Alisedimentitalea sp. MJ-SS2]|nr:DUF6455 family protein [Alisedimentitalea sp. MJ-SS2]
MRSNEIPLGDPATHFWLTRSAARAMGVNLSEAMATGQLTPRDYSEMVTNCRACHMVEGCQHWLATEAVTRCKAYESCLNKGLLERLQDEVLGLHKVPA